MRLRRKCYFPLTDFGGGRDRLWEGPLPLSSPLQGDLFWATLQDAGLWSPDIISIPLPFTSTCIPHPEGRCLCPKHPFHLNGSVRWDQPGSSGVRLWFRSASVRQGSCLLHVEDMNNQ